MYDNDNWKVPGDYLYVHPSHVEEGTWTRKMFDIITDYSEGNSWVYSKAMHWELEHSTSGTMPMNFEYDYAPPPSEWTWAQPAGRKKPRQWWRP